MSGMNWLNSVLEKSSSLPDFIKELNPAQVNKYMTYLERLYGGINNYESQISRYLQPIALNDYFNRVRQINCTSNHQDPIFRAINSLRNESDSEDRNFVVTMCNYSSMYLTVFVMGIIEGATADPRIKHGNEGIERDYKRILKDGVELLKSYKKLGCDTKTQKTISNDIERVTSLISTFNKICS